MNIKAKLKNKLSELLFLEMKKERINSIFDTNIHSMESMYLPIIADNIINKVKNGQDANSIPIGHFLEGMVYVLGADGNFKFNESYKQFIVNTEKSIEYIKGRIAQNVKLQKYEEAYILLKGLLEIEETKEIYEKLIHLLENLRETNNEYIEEEIEIIEKAKGITNFPLPYYYEGIIKNQKGDFQGALVSIENYLLNGGKETNEVLELKSSLKLLQDYRKGKELVYEEPEKALAILLPLQEEMGDNSEIYYYIAVSYRVLENYNKSIYYLERSIELDSSFPEAFNEMGINYACLEDFNAAIKFFRKVFEVTKSIEVCTNLIMCYININDYKQAKVHLEIAKKLDSQDEIVKQLEVILKDKN